MSHNVFVQTGMCKHLHVGFTIAATHGTDVVERRRLKAMEIYQNYNFHVEDGHLHIMDGNHIGVVNLASSTCLCVAFSHGINCVCAKVAELWAADNNASPPPGDSEDTTEVDTENTNEDSVKAKSLTPLQKLNAIQEWMQENTSQITSRHTIHINALYSSIFSKYKRVTKKRKIESVNPQRLAINKPKKIKMGRDHIYCSTLNKPKRSSSSKKADGSFKTKSRTKGGRRKPFQ